MMTIFACLKGRLWFLHFEEQKHGQYQFCHTFIYTHYPSQRTEGQHFGKKKQQR